MHYLSQVLAILLTLFILILWRVHKKTGTSSEPIFLMLIITALASEVLDIATQFAIAPYPIYTSEITTKIIIKLYLASIITYLFGIGLYTNKNVNQAKRKKKVGIQMASIFVVAIVVTCLLKVDYIYHPDCSIISGPAVIFVMCVNAAVGTFYSLVLNIRKEASPWNRIITTVWVSTFVLGIMFQYFTIQRLHLPVISVTMAVGIMFLFLCNENPGSKFDYDSDCFFYDTFVEYIQDVIANEINQACLMVSMHIKNPDNVVYCQEIFNDLVNNKEYDSLKFFKGTVSELYISADDKDDLVNIELEIKNTINKIEKKNNQIKLYTTMVLIPDINTVKSHQLVKAIFDYYRSKGINDSESIITEYIDDQLLVKYKKRFLMVNDIERAVRDDKVVVEYQIINNLTTDTVYAQAYSNIYLENNSVLTTNDYYEIAVEYDQLKDIRSTKLKMLNNTIKDIISNKDNKLGIVLLHTSIQELEDEMYYNEYISAFNKDDEVLSKTCLEITNIETITNKDVLINNISKLQNHGVKLAISGFGYGEANLNYLIDLPIHFVRFDKTILEKAITDQNVLNIIKDVTELARSLKIGVIVFGDTNNDYNNIISECNIDMYFDDSAPMISNNEFTRLCINKGGSK